MADGNILEKTFYSLSQLFAKLSGVSRSNVNASNYQFLVDKPAWLALSNARQYRQAVAENPVLFGCIDILASCAARGKKYLVDLNEKVIPWNSKRPAVQNARRLFVERPNPLQSAKEYNLEHYFMFYTFGNNYVYTNNSLKTFQTDITTVRTLFNLPSEYVTVRQTGKLYDQVELKGIIEKYSLTNYNPVKEFDPDNIIHFNDLNLSDVGNSIIGTSRLENLRMPITNTQLAFEAMNVLLKHRGMQGIIKANNKDATGTQIPLQPEQKDEIDAVFKSEYGLREKQKQFMISYSDINFIRTVMSPEELGIYNDFSNNAMIISNGFRIPPEIYKTYVAGATFENQVQAVRRLYQDTIIPMVENEDLYYTERLKMRDYGFELRTDFSHIEALQDAFKEKAMALTYNANTAEKSYNNNIITWNQYLELLDMEPVDGGDIYKYERDKMTKTETEPAINQTIEE